METVAPHDFLATFAAAGLTVLFGAAYAALFAWSKIVGGKRLLGLAAGLCYLALASAVWALSRLAHFDGRWQFLAGLMLFGYWLAPMGVWRLCVAGHGGEFDRAHRSGSADPEGDPSDSPSRVQLIHSNPTGGVSK
jgi:hypothetical protein